MYVGMVKASDLAKACIGVLRSTVSKLIHVSEILQGSTKGKATYILGRRCAINTHLPLVCGLKAIPYKNADILRLQ